MTRGSGRHGRASAEGSDSDEKVGFQVIAKVDGSGLGRQQ